MRRLGWRVQGLEPDPAAVKVARERGVPVVTGMLETAPLDEGVFDAVTMNHVIEHVIDPVNALARCLVLLRPGGQLVVTTPNLDSLGHRWWKGAWRGLEPPRHLYLFTQKTLSYFVEQAGFKIEEIKSVSYVASYIWMASKIIASIGRNPGMRDNGMTWSLWAQGFSFGLVEGLINLFHRRVGEELVLIAKKSDKC